MHLFTSLLLTGLFLTGVVSLPVNSAAQPPFDATSGQTHLVQKRGQSKHRGSGRIEWVTFVDAPIS